MIQTGLITIVLLIISNIFMIFAWYGHLKLQESGHSASLPLYAIILFSWGIALAEYIFQVPANRMGFVGNGGPFTLMQLKVMQEVITLVVFVVFANCFFQGSELKWNHLVAFLMLIGAVYFVFLDSPSSH
ncbi:MAG: DMT family protein [Rikenellaceae bacterium]